MRDAMTNELVQLINTLKNTPLRSIIVAVAILAGLEWMVKAEKAFDNSELVLKELVETNKELLELKKEVRSKMSVKEFLAVHDKLKQSGIILPELPRETIEDIHNRHRLESMIKENNGG